MSEEHNNQEADSAPANAAAQDKAEAVEKVSAQPKASPVLEGPAPDKIGFPSGTLAEEPMRFDVLASAPGIFAAINKPADILMDSYLGAPKQKSVILALRAQSGKPELGRLGMEAPLAVNQIDIEYSGAAIIAMNKDIATVFRNAMWSGKFKFEFIVLCKSMLDKNKNFTTNLPLLMHDERPVWIVSHRFGKKAQTSFEILETSNGYQTWRATAQTLRPNQVRVHAAENGLRVVGEWLYGRTPYIFLSDLKDEYRASPRKEEKSLYPHLMVHLSAIEFNGADVGFPDLGKVRIEAPLPKNFKLCLKKLSFKNTDGLEKKAP